MTTSPRIAIGVGVLVLVAAAGVGCQRLPNPIGPDPIRASVPDFSAETAFCVDEINRLRATVGDPPLTRSDRIDAFSSEAARVDGAARVAHMHFRQTNGGNGTVRAENMIPWWKLSNYGSVRTLISRGLGQMWAQGPNGDHYKTMRGGYTEIGCGVYLQNGEVTVSQDFR